MIQGVGGGETKDVSLDFLQQIVEARVSEILEAAFYLIEKSGYINKIPTGLVITGGTAYMEHIKELARAITGMRVRLANAQGNISEASQRSCFDTTSCSIVGALIDSFNNESEIEEGHEVKRIDAKPARDNDMFREQNITKMTLREKLRRDKEEKQRIRQEQAAEKAARNAKQAEEEEKDEPEEETPSEPSKIERRWGDFIKDIFDTGGSN